MDIPRSEEYGHGRGSKNISSPTSSLSSLLEDLHAPRFAVCSGVRGASSLEVERLRLWALCLYG